MTVLRREVTQSSEAGRTVEGAPHSVHAGSPDRACTHPPSPTAGTCLDLGRLRLAQRLPQVADQHASNRHDDGVVVFALGDHQPVLPA